MAAPQPAPNDERDLLRFITCGSVDDGKSTLIGRLLHDAGAVPDDLLSALERDSRSHGAAGDHVDYALLVDGLTAEREQGITIDVAYRYFATARRKFIVADCPGHEQYTRNMVTGASTADVAVVLVDARKGVLTQTRRHSHLVSLLGIRAVILAVTKMDLVDWSEDIFQRIVTDYRSFADSLNIGIILPIPVSGLDGDNIVAPSARAPWFEGQPLLQTLEAPDIEQGSGARFALPVQWVNRPDLDFRGYAGRIACGRVRPGDALRVMPSGQTAHVRDLLTFDGVLAEAQAGQSVTVTLDRDIDVTRGDVLVAANQPLECADQFEAAIVWMSEEAMLPGRVYTLKIGARSVSAQITDIRHRIDVNSNEHLAARHLDLNGIGICHLSLGHEVAFTPYAENRELGGFILIDRQTNATVAAGMIHFALRRAHNIHRQALKVGRESRAQAKGQKPAVVWLTGLSGSGKSTIANALESRLVADGRHTMLIDGDNLRHGLSRDLGFTDADRVENIRRAAESARMMADAGLIVIVSLISPFAAERLMAREMMAGGEFFEVFVDVPLEIAEARDPKGLYRKARAGDLANFTGIDSPYEVPSHPEIHVRSDHGTPEDAAEAIVSALAAADRLTP